MDDRYRESPNFLMTIAIALLVSLLTSTAYAQNSNQSNNNSKGLSPLQVAKIKQVADAVISPDGKTIAYTVSHPANPFKKNKPVSYHLYVRGINDSSGTAYISSMSVSDIAFRPGHRAVTFLAKREDDETEAVYQVDLKSGDAHKLFSFPRSIEEYSWAPDGKHLAFMAVGKKPQSDSLLPYHPEIYEEDMPQRRGYVTNLAKKGHQAHQLQIEGSIYAIKWAPDSSKTLAVAVAPSPRVDDYYMKQTVMITGHHGKKILGTVRHKGKLGQIEWGPKGNRLALLGAADINDPTAGRLFVVSKAGGTPTMLRPDFDGKFEQIQWNDSTTIQYLSSKGVWSTYGSIQANGTNMQTLIPPGKTNLQYFSQSDSGATVFLAEKSTHPQELYVMEAGSDNPERVTNSNPWLKDVALGEQKVVTWKAEDGLKLQGMLIYPLNYVEGKRYPMITVVHGGPESHYDNGWLTDYFEPGQVGAGDGYFVFYPNYRGSTGRGLEFAKSSQGDMAGAEFDDIVSGVDELVAGSIADKSRVGVTGASYGGYATAWLSTRYTDRFAAGVMFVGISNNISKWGTTDIPQELFQVHARRRVWDDYMGFLKRSPIYYAGKTKTPLLIMAGKEDTRVDPGQSYEMYRHIKIRTDTPVRLVLYPGEGHGNRNATAQYDYNLRMMRWFNTFLKGNQEDKPDYELDIKKKELTAAQ